MSSNLFFRIRRSVPVHRTMTTYFHPMLSLKQMRLTLVPQSLSLSPVCCYSGGVASNDSLEPKDDPVKYTTSKAHTYWKAAYNWRDPNFYEHTPRSQRMVVMWSTAAVLIYFCLLREENDIDDIIYQPITKTVPYLEEPLIEASITEHKRHGRSSVNLEKRLMEIKTEKSSNLTDP